MGTNRQVEANTGSPNVPLVSKYNNPTSIATCVGVVGIRSIIILQDFGRGLETLHTHLLHT